MKIKRLLLPISLLLLVMFAGCLNQDESKLTTSGTKYDVSTEESNTITTIEDLDMSSMKIAKKAEILYPLDGSTVYGNQLNAPQRAMKKVISDPTDSTIITSVLTGIQASIDVSTTVGFSTGDTVGVYVFINNKVVEYIENAGVADAVVTSNGYVELKDDAGDAADKITLGDAPAAGGAAAAKTWKLAEGVNEIALVVYNKITGAQVYIGKTATTPIQITVDNTAPILQVNDLVDGDYLDFAIATSGYQPIDIDLIAGDASDTSLMAFISQDDGASAADATGFKPVIINTDSWISPTKSITLNEDSQTKIAVETTGGGTNWYLYLQVEDDPQSDKNNKYAAYVQSDFTVTSKLAGALGTKIQLILEASGTDEVTIDKDNGEGEIEITLDGDNTTAETFVADIDAILNADSDLKSEFDKLIEISAATGSTDSVLVKADTDNVFLALSGSPEAGNKTFKKINIVPDTRTLLATADVSVKYGEFGALAAYSADMKIKDTLMEIQLISDSTDATAEIIRYENSTSGLVEKASLEMDHLTGSTIYKKQFDLVNDLAYTLEPNDSFSFEVKVVAPTGNEVRKTLTFIYQDDASITTSITDAQIILNDTADNDDYSTNTITPIADSEEDVIYLGTYNQVIYNVFVYNPENFDYEVEIAGATVSATSAASNDSDYSYFNIADYTFDFDDSTTNAVATLKVILGDNVVATKKIVVMPNYGTTATPALVVDYLKILQNQSIAEIEGSISNMPAEAAEYVEVQARLADASAGTNTLVGESGSDETGPWTKVSDLTLVDNTTLSFSGQIDWLSAGSYDYVQVRLYNPKATYTTAETAAANIYPNLLLDSDGTDGTQEVVDIQINGLAHTATEWKIAEEEQTLTIDNTQATPAAGDIETIKVYLDGVEELSSDGDAFTTTELAAGVDLDFTGINTLKITATVFGASTTLLEREVTLSRVTDKPSFISVPSNRTWYGETEDTVVISGEVTNADSVTILDLYYYDSSAVKTQAGGTDGTDTNAISMTLLTDGTFTSAELKASLIEGEDYTAVLKASKSTGAFVTSTFTFFYDTVAPTEAKLTANVNSYKRFPEAINEATIVQAGTTTETLYVNEDGDIVTDATTPATPNTYLDTAGTDYSFTSEAGTVSYTIDDSAISTAKDTYIALVQNQKGYNDYLIGYVGISESDGAYDTIDSAEDVILMIEDEFGNQVSGGRVQFTSGLSGDDREFMVNLGDNQYSSLNVYLMDLHFNKTTAYEFTNNIYVDLASTDFTATIEEGAKDPVSGEMIPWKEVRVASQDDTTKVGLSDLQFTFYKDTIGGDYFGGRTDVDLTGTTDVVIALSGSVASGDTVAISMKDRYGNTANSLSMAISGEPLTVTVTDELVPELPTGVAVTNQSKKEGLMDIISGNAEAGSTVKAWGRETSSDPLVVLAETTTLTDGTFSLEVDGDVNNYVALEVIDVNGNSTKESSIETGTLVISDKFARSYNKNITGITLGSTQSSYKIGDTIDITWTEVTDTSTDINKGNTLSFYDVKFIKDSVEIGSTSSSAASVSFKPEEIGTFDLADISIQIYAESLLGFGSSTPGQVMLTMDSSAPDVTGLDTTEIIASVDNQIVSVGVAAINNAVAGIGKSGDSLSVKINGIDPNSGANWNIGTITNTTTVTAIIVDLAGNESAPVYVVATDDKAPEITDLYRTMITQTGTQPGELLARIKHTSEDNVTVIAYDGVPTATGSTEIGRVLLSTQGVSQDMSITANSASDVYIVLEDSLGNSTAADPAKKLDELTLE